MDPWSRKYRAVMGVGSGVLHFALSMRNQEDGGSCALFI